MEIGHQVPCDKTVIHEEVKIQSLQQLKTSISKTPSQPKFDTVLLIVSLFIVKLQRALVSGLLV